jgi:acyl carrier protein
MTLFRDRKGITKRKSGYREPYTLYVIASEGTETEPLYFSYLQNYVKQHKELNRLVKIESLSRKLKNDTATDSAHIIELLDDFKKEYTIKQGDELWLLVDRDRQPKANLAQVAQKCQQKGYEFCLTTPCFELWLLLHLKDLKEYSEKEQQDFLKNSKVNSTRTRIEKEVSDLMVALGSGFSKSRLDMSIFFPHIQDAINRAHDLTLEKGWDYDQFCTRVHVLVSRILKI